MSSVAAHSWHLIIEQIRDCLNGTRIGDVIEHLDTPPPNPGVRICQPFNDRVKDRFGEFSHFELSGRDPASEATQRLDFLAPLAEFLNEPLLRRHSTTLDPRRPSASSGSSSWATTPLAGIEGVYTCLPIARASIRRPCSASEICVEVPGQMTFGPPKTRAGHRTVPLPQSIAEELGDHLRRLGAGPRDLVFPAPEGAAVRLSLWRRRIWGPAVEKAGLEPLRIHDMRHTAVALWIAAGASPQ